MEELEKELCKHVEQVIQYAKKIENRSLDLVNRSLLERNNMLSAENTSLEKQMNKYKEKCEDLQKSVDTLNIELQEYWEIKSLYNLYKDLVKHYDSLIKLLPTDIRPDDINDEILYDREKSQIKSLKLKIDGLEKEVELWRR